MTNSLRIRSALDVSPAALEEISNEAVKLVSEYFSTISQRDVLAKNYAGKTTAKVDSKLGDEGVPLPRLIDECRTIMDLSRHNGHPRFFGYVASPSTPVGAYADLITSALNANSTCWRSSPAGTEIEKIVVRWLGTLIGYDDNAKGLLTSGGSMANLTALMIASRRKLGANVAQKGWWNSGPPLTVYASEEVHMSIAKAIDILGLGRDHVRAVKTNDQLQIDLDNLRLRICEDLDDGFRPFCVVASAGTTNTGAIDPLNEIAALAKEFDLWFHVDGAYGAPGVLDQRKKNLFSGLELADSVSLDPHKWLYVPIDAGCLLFRDEATAKAAFNTDEADYLKVHGLVDDERFAYWDYGVELSRRFRALKIWMTLRYYGVNRLAQTISEDIALAEYLGELVSKDSDFELLAPVGLSICCFRYQPPELSETELNQLNERVLAMVQQSGQAYISNATIGGRFALRVCITNFRTTKEDIERTLEIVREAGKRLSNSLA